MIFQQLFESQTSTYTYLLACEKTREAVLIDPVLDCIERDLKLISELQLNLVYVIDTHIHADHITAAGELRRRAHTLGVAAGTAAGAASSGPVLKTAVSAGAKVVCADVSLKQGSQIQFGEQTLAVFETPGHTDSCICLYSKREGVVFTGDTLLIRGTGRTDFQQGSAAMLFESVKQNLFTLPPETKVYPGHDYKGFTSSTIDAEMKWNPRLGGGKSKTEFMKIMSELKLADPKRIHEAVPANMGCGVQSPKH